MSAPTRSEVELQLQKILKSKRFKGAESQSKLLECLVDLTLNNIEPKHDLILAIVFPNAPPEGTHVRVTIGPLRKRLAAYNANEGSDDPVEISLPATNTDKHVKLPPGAAYRPAFTLKSNQAVRQNLALALYTSVGTPTQQQKACDYFLAAIKERPRDPTIHYHWSLFLLEFALRERGEEDHRFLLDAAFQSLVIATPAYDWFYEYRLALAIIHRCDRNFDLYEKQLAKAMKLDKASTERHYLYWELQILDGQGDEAIESMRREAQARPEDLDMQVSLAAQLYAYKNSFDEAEAILKKVLTLDRNQVSAHAQLLIMYAETGQPALAIPEMERCRELLELEDYLVVLDRAGFRENPPSDAP